MRHHWKVDAFLRKIVDVVSILLADCLHYNQFTSGTEKKK